MSSPEKVAQLAVQCAREAVDRLLTLVDSVALRDDYGRAADIALIELTQAQRETASDRITWEGHAALNLLLAAQAELCPPADDDQDR